MMRFRDRPYIDLRSLLALVFEISICITVVIFAVQNFTLPVILLSMFILATRQHALYMLYHDAVHGLIARERRVNDLIINLFVGIPQLIPVQWYRRFHISHHASFGTPSDPEQLLLFRWQPWNYRALPWPRFVLQLAGDLLLVNMILGGIALLYEQHKTDSRLRLPGMEMTFETIALAVCFVLLLGLWFWYDPDSFLRFSLLWFGTLFTLTNALQKIRSFAEHGPIGCDRPVNSWRPGLIGRLIFWPYNINYHREHHDHPDVPWHMLPARFGGSTEGNSTRDLLPYLIKLS